MTQFGTIPKELSARDPMEYEQKIPRIIWQTMKTNLVPAPMKSYADSWIDLNPEYEYRFFDDNDIISFLKTDFPDYLEGYRKLKYGASKADLWRYLIIYKYGGIYADMDCRCITPLREWIDPNAAFVTQIGINIDICQWLIISVPNNLIFLKAAQKTLKNSENNNCESVYHGFKFDKNKLSIRENSPLIKFNHPILGLSGPPVLQEAAEEWFREGAKSEILPFFQIVCVSGSVSCQMNGHVRHETGNNEYRKSLIKLKLIHYNGRLAKAKRKIISLFIPRKFSK